MTTIPRWTSALDELALKDWMTDLSEAPSILEVHYQRYMNIDYIHLQSVYMWIHGPMGMFQWPGAPHGTVHMLEDVPPPWNPTLQDVEDIITFSASRRGLSMNGKLIQILQYRGRYNVDLTSPFLREHITYLQELCNEFKVLYDRVEVTDTDEGEDEGEDEDAFDYDLYEDDAEYPMEPLSPETLRIVNRNLDAEFLAEADAITHSITTEAAETVTRRLQETEIHNSLCSEGVNILDRIMDTDTRELNEGDYLKLMNLFRDLHT